MTLRYATAHLSVILGISTQTEPFFLIWEHNERMRYGLLFGWGVIIYALMFLLWSGFVTYGFVDGIAPRIIGLLVLIAVALIAGLSLRYNSWSDILPYSIAWALMMGLFDAIFSVPYSGWQLYLDWNIWFGYAVVALVPIFSPHFQFQRVLSRPPQGY